MKLNILFLLILITFYAQGTSQGRISPAEAIRVAELMKEISSFQPEEANAIKDAAIDKIRSVSPDARITCVTILNTKLSYEGLKMLEQLLLKSSSSD